MLMKFFVLSTRRYLSQFVGGLQGKVACHMGDLGKSSLTPQMLKHLLAHVMDDLSKSFGETEQSIPSPTAANHAMGVLRPLRGRQRVGLELAARLLAASQQEFLCQSQWEGIDVSNALLSLLKVEGSRPDEWVQQEVVKPVTCRPEKYLESPWARCVLLPLADQMDWRSFAGAHAQSLAGLSARIHLMDGQTIAASSLEDTFPLLANIQNSYEFDKSQKWTTTLTLICTCSDMFPSGLCWSSDFFNGIKAIPPSDAVADEAVLCPTCTAEDLSTLVFLLTAFLDEQGGSAGGQQTQVRIISALCKLTEVTYLLSNYLNAGQSSGRNNGSLAKLEWCWQLVWRTLFRSELRYVDHTKHATPSSYGELVLALIRRIVQYKCTDIVQLDSQASSDNVTGFARDNQTDVWKLPVFQSVYYASSVEVFYLISWICNNCGLSYSGIDQIDHSISRFLTGETRQQVNLELPSQSRRCRLLLFSLGVIDMCLDTQLEESAGIDIMRAATLSVGALIRGRVCFFSAFSTGQQRTQWRDSCLEKLWRNEACLSHVVDDLFVEDDAALHMATVYRETSFSEMIPSASRTLDFVPEAEGVDLYTMTRYWAMNHFNLVSYDGNQAKTIELINGERDWGTRILGLKFLFTIELCNERSAAESAFLTNIGGHFITFLSGIPTAVGHQAFRKGMVNLSTIAAALLEALSICSMDCRLPFHRVSEVCRNLLSCYMERLTKRTVMSVDTVLGNDGSKVMNDGLFDDSDDEKNPTRSSPTSARQTSVSPIDAGCSCSDDESLQHTNRRKRKVPRSSVQNKKARTIDPPDSTRLIQDIHCAEAVGHILLMVEPSVSHCGIVCRSLLGADYDLDPSDLRGDVDLRAAPICLSFLTSHGPILHSVARDHLSSTKDTSTDTVVCLLHKVLDLIRVNTMAPHDKPATGYNTLASVLNRRAGSLNLEMQPEDQSLLVECLSFSGGIATKAFLRAARVNAATRSFIGASATFHQIWDKHFCSTVKSALTDSNWQVRRMSRIGLGFALEFLEEVKVWDAIAAAVPPIPESIIPDERLKTLERWCKRVGFHQVLDDNFSDTLVGDTLETMELESLLIRASIASKLQDRKLFQDFLYELAMVPLSRPDLETAIYQALSKVAYSRDYDSVENMIDVEISGIIFRWAADQQTSLPLVITAPHVLRLITQATGARIWNGHAIDVESLKHDAMLSFLRQYHHLLVPICVFNLSLRVPTAILEHEDSETPMSLLAGHHPLCSVTSHLFGLDDPDSIELHDALRSMLKKSIPDIRAFCYPMNQSSNNDHQLMAERSLSLLGSSVTVGEIESRTTKKAHVLTRRIMDLIVFSDKIPALLPQFDSPFYDGISAAIEDALGTSSLSGDKLRKIGNNTMGGLIGSFSRLERATSKAQHRSYFRSISLQAKLIDLQIGNGREKYASMAFCIHLLTEIMLKPQLGSLRLDVLVLLKGMLRSGMQENREEFGKEIAPILMRLLAAIFHLHGNCQKEILEGHRERDTAERQALCSSHGLCLWNTAFTSLDTSDTWGWDSGAYQWQKNVKSELSLKSIRPEIQQIIAETYSIVKWVLDQSNDFLIDALALVPIAPPFDTSQEDLERLQALRKDFAIQLEISEYPAFQIRPTTCALAEELSSRLRSRESWVSTRSASGRDSPQIESDPLNIDQKLIQCLLIQLERNLGSKELSAPSDLNSLLGPLSFICSGPWPRELKLVASRCLGKMNSLNITDSAETAISISGSWSIRLPVGEDPAHFFHVQLLSALGGCVRSSQAMISQVAFDTIEALLSTENGHHALESPSMDKCRSQLALITSLVRKKETCVILTAAELNHVLHQAGVVEDHRANPDFCWDKRLWLAFESRQVAFEDWVCAVTTALVVSCTAARLNGKSRQRDSQGEFFWLCQRICSIDPNIASDIFPFLVLYLLDLSENNASEIDFNKLLTSSFSEVLKNYQSSHGSLEGAVPESKALQLIVDTIDFLRRVSQDRFLSEKHKRNVQRVPGRESPKAKVRAAKYNAGIQDSPQWLGVPYGSVMRLDGLLVAEGCIQLRRHASALFFLELFLNAQFRKVEEVFEDFSAGSDCRQLGSNDISGKMKVDSAPALGGVDSEKNKILRTMAVVSSCYKFMREDDAFEAVQVQSSAVEFHNYGWDIQQSSQGRRDPVGVLRSLNSNPHTHRKQDTTLVIDSMDALEFHAMLGAYLDGALADSATIQSLKRVEAEALVEKWHENHLRGMLWEFSSSVKPSNATSSASADDGIIKTAIRSIQQSTGLRFCGYFSSLTSALDFFRREDNESCRNYLIEARMSIIEEVSRFGGIEFSTSAMAAIVKKLQALHLFEMTILPDQVSKTETNLLDTEIHFESNLALMLNYLQSDPLDGETAITDDTLTFRWLKEVCLRAAYAKKRVACEPGRHELLSSLTSHLCSSVVHARELGRPFIAAESIQRLHGLLKHCDSSFNIEEGESNSQILLLRLEESKILESQGDFKGAIKKSSQIVDQLLGQETRGGHLGIENEHILIDAQLFCGKWFTKYRLRQASNVLEGFLQPAAKRAMHLLEHQESENQDKARNEDKAAKANLAIGQIVSGLYKALVLRVQSPDWKTSSSTLHLKSELSRCEPLLQAANAKRSRAKKNSKQYEAANNRYEELYIFCEQLRKDLRRTEEERWNIIESMGRYLDLAISSYATALSHASTGINEDLSRPVTELMSLWFDNSKPDGQNELGINTLMHRAFEKIPTFRLVPFSNQLFSGIETGEASNETEAFQAVLQDLVYHMCSDHPYHCLLSLFALANGAKVGSGVGGRHAENYLENVGNSKVDAADSILARLKQGGSSQLIDLLDGYAPLIDSYIALADADTAAFHKQNTKNVSFAKVATATTRTLDKCFGRSILQSRRPAIFTAPPTIQPTAQYHDTDGKLVGGETISGFKSTFDITETGLHRPKIVVCYGSNAGEYRQLVKGEDDIRQDAIMSQVFKAVNSLMVRRKPDADQKTGPKRSPHRLRMARYNVVPLSPASGVLEWVENTTSFGDVVLGNGIRSTDVGLHARYYPQEWHHSLCRKHFAGAPESVKRETFDVICQHFSPCFRFFFVEQFGHDMMHWHSARMRYTRSVAVSSMVGHILGIGDRHTSNILVHKRTGEIVQIDFGIVFEQGRVSSLHHDPDRNIFFHSGISNEDACQLLHTPERVPFRLTRNMVDGMGPTGTEGTFVRSSEETIRVLRKNASTLLTILSAVVADPLYKWSVSPVQGMRRQKLGPASDGPLDTLNEETGDVFDGGGESSDEKNEMGKKAIARINDKLQGYEESTSGEQQGVEGQVQLLINSARDVENLSPMYAGWGPYI